MRVVPVDQAVGMMLGHDVTEIVPDVFKGRAFKKGHIIQPEDVGRLLDIGKENIYVVELNQGTVHEDEAALQIAEAAAGPGIRLTDSSEGKVGLVSTMQGLLKINVEGLHQINWIEDIVFSTLHTHQHVPEGKTVAGTRIIPLMTGDDKIRQVENVCEAFYPLISVKSFKQATVGIITTGSEIYRGRIKDKFGPVLRKKFDQLGSRVVDQIMVSDEIPMTVEAINSFVTQKVDLIVVTGGMSVDPDDQTPTSIRAAGADIITYGAPIFPGAMFLIGYIDDIPILGLPGCVMYYRASIFDLMVPRILAGEKPSRRDIISLGHGGLCCNCSDCRYPDCGFGKGE